MQDNYKRLTLQTGISLLFVTCGFLLLSYSIILEDTYMQ